MKKIFALIVILAIGFGLAQGDDWFRDPSGNYWLEQRIEIDDSTFLNLVASIPFGHIIAEGGSPGHTPFLVIGQTDSIVSTLDDISEIDVQTLPVPGGSNDSAIFLEFVSTSDDDSIGNAGALTILIDGLDSNWIEQADTIILEGIVPVNSTKVWLRVNDVAVDSIGTYGGTAVGDILVRDTSGTTIYDKISAGGNRSHQCLFTVPDGKTAFIEGWFPGIIAQVTGDNTYFAVLRATCTIKERKLKPGLWLFQDEALLINSTVYRPFPYPLKCPEHTDIKVSAKRIDGNKSATVTVSVSMFLQDD